MSKKIQNVRKMTLTYKAQLKKLKEEAKKLSDPKTFNQGRKRIQQNFIQNLSTIKVPQLSKKKQMKFIIGPISVGKSSILKKFFNVPVKTGKGQTTLKVSKVYQNEQIQVYDSPGINEDYDITKFQNVVQLFGMDQFYVCYNSSLKNVQLILRILSAISSRNGQKIYLIKTQCDSFSEDDIRTLDEQLQIDRKFIENMRKQNLINQAYSILATSTVRDLPFRDNYKLKELLYSTNKQLKYPSNIQSLD